MFGVSDLVRVGDEVEFLNGLVDRMFVEGAVVLLSSASIVGFNDGDVGTCATVGLDFVG